MNLKLKVELTDGTVHNVEAKVVDVVAWEKTNKAKVSDWEKGIALGDMCFLAWHTLKRLNETPLPFEKWLEKVSVIESEESDDPKATSEEV
jgi:hypothetical protein